VFGRLKPAADAVEFRILKFFHFQLLIVAFGHVSSPVWPSFPLGELRWRFIAAVTDVTNKRVACRIMALADST
jgi:hypothetical protein